MAGVAATFLAAEAEITSLEKQNKANEADNELQRLAIVGAMVKEVATARGAADEAVLALNDLSIASANLATLKKKVGKAFATLSFQGWVGDDKKDPQYVNVVMRRIYNTKLLRYEKALERAKKLAFIARRAVELRYGVDLQRMHSDMTLVKAPATWVNDVCTMQGIDYSKIRQPEQTATKDPFANSPVPGDDFSTEYIGDYITRLEDFVNSYPIDYPLKDGDDTAVISLADDIFRVTDTCAKPGRNLLYYSTEFDKRDGIDVDSETQGWFVRGLRLDHRRWRCRCGWRFGRRRWHRLDGLRGD